MVVNLWRTHLSSWLPEKYGNHEPISIPFDAADPEAIVQVWGWPVLAKKRRPRMDASIWCRHRPELKQHASVCFTLQHDAVDQSELLDFLCTASAALHADFACIHLLSQSNVNRERERKIAHALNSAATRFFCDIYSQDLQRRIPDLFWATIFGKPYTTSIGLERLTTAPVYKSTTVAPDMVCLQLSERLQDVQEDPVRLDVVRRRCTEHIGSEYFYSTEREIAGAYTVPSFHFT